MGACTRALPADEIAVGGGDAALAWRHRLVVHGEAHGAAGLAPFETGLPEDLVQAFGFGLPLDVFGARYDPRAHVGGNLPSAGHGGCGTQVGDAAVGARS